MSTTRITAGLHRKEYVEKEQRAKIEIEQCAKAIDIILKGFVSKYSSTEDAKNYLEQVNGLLNETDNKKKIEDFKSSKLWGLIKEAAEKEKSEENTDFMQCYMDLVLSKDDKVKQQMLKTVYNYLPTEKDDGSIMGNTKRVVNIDNPTKAKVLHKPDGSLKNVSDLTAADIHAVAVCGGGDNGGPAHMIAADTMRRIQLPKPSQAKPDKDKSAEHSTLQRVITGIMSIRRRGP